MSRQAQLTISTDQRPVLHVAAGALTDSAGRILIAQRAADAHMGGCWEFPGGKIASGETPLQGLVRELQEELAITARYARLVARYPHAYPDRIVYLYVWQVLGWDGETRGVENQPLRWVPVETLNDAGLLPADALIVERLQALAAAAPGRNDPCISALLT